MKELGTAAETPNGKKVSPIRSISLFPTAGRPYICFFDFGSGQFTPSISFLILTLPSSYWASDLLSYNLSFPLVAVSELSLSLPLL